jgi:hypothetical protein
MSCGRAMATQKWFFMETMKVHTYINPRLLLLK